MKDITLASPGRTPRRQKPAAPPPEPPPTPTGNGQVAKFRARWGQAAAVADIPDETPKANGKEPVTPRARYGGTRYRWDGYEHS